MTQEWQVVSSPGKKIKVVQEKKLEVSQSRFEVLARSMDQQQQKEMISMAEQQIA